MPLAELGAPRTAPCWCLREVCRRRLLQEMVRLALPSSSGLAGPGSQERVYLVLVADALTLRMVTSVCQVHDLLAESVWGVQCIESTRRASPALDALYFIAPTVANVEQLVRDLLDRGPKYRGFHIFFSHKLRDELLQSMTRAQGAVARVRSFAELNLSFLAHDDRAFHLDDRGSLAELLGDAPAESASLADAACRLATLAACLPAKPGILYAARSAGSSSTLRLAGPGGSAGICERLARELHVRLEEMEARGVAWQQPARPGDCTLLIVDRSIDWIPLLAHDMHYEAAVYDLLGGSSVSLEQGRFTTSNPSGGRAGDRTMALGDAQDGLWERCRHMPLWSVNALVAQEIKAWTRKDEEMRRRTSSSSSVPQQVSTTLGALQSLPEHRDRFHKLQMHSDICHQCTEAIEAQRLVDIGAFEQDLATGMDRTGARLSPKAVEKELLGYLRDPQLDGSSVKVRLLLLYLSSPEGAGCPEARRRELARHLAAEDWELALSAQWAAAQCSERPEAAERRRQHFRESLRSRSPRAARLSRWQPRLRDLLEELARGVADQEAFPQLRRHQAPSLPPARGGASVAAAVPQQVRAVAVFVVGGITLPEVRAAHEASRALGVEAFVGGSCLLTPAALLGALRSL